MATEKTFSFEYQELYESELSVEEREDLEAAKKAREEAYQPYSKFKVGAAIRTKDGEIFTGWNSECIDYLVLHAETNACGNIPRVSREAGIERITIIGAMENDMDSSIETAPCGACRQKLLEFTKIGDDPYVIMASIRGKIIKVGLRDILPFAFFPDSLTPIEE